MKKSNLILSLAFLTTPLFCQENSSNLEFRNLQENLNPISIKVKFDYDLNGDSLTDLSTISAFKKDSLGELVMPKAPTYYLFYKQEKGINKIVEILYDKKSDGINANEEILYSEPKKKKTKSTDIIL